MESKETQDLVAQESREVVNPFPLTKDLFDFARTQLSRDTSFDTYVNPELKDEGVRVVELPEKFKPFVADYPGDYFVVYYINRRDPYYREGTRAEQTGLSTAQHRYDSDRILREIDIKEHDSSDKKGNVIFVTVAERVNEEGFTRINTAGSGEVNQPHGSRELEYQMDSNGTKRTIRSRFNRLDEGIFSWGGVDKPVRWVRNLDIEKPSEDRYEMTYRDAYLVGHDERGLTEEQAEVKIKIKGSGSEMSSIIVEIGIGSSDKDKVLFEDPGEQIKVIVHSAEGMKISKNQAEIIKQDPNYAFLFEKPVDKAKLIELIQSRTSFLQNDWDKPHAVFTQNQIEATPDALPDKAK